MNQLRYTWLGVCGKIDLDLQELLLNELAKMEDYMSYYLDEEKIKAKVVELNVETAALSKLINKPNLPSLILKPTDDSIQVWEAVPGLYWYDEATRFGIEEPVNLMPSGILLKLFSNKKTGEFRSFPAKMFEKNI